MRWLKWGLVAGWLGVHALLWMLLPPVPYARLTGDIPSPYAYLHAFSGPTWSWGPDVSSGNKFAFSGDGKVLVTRDAGAINSFDLDTRHSISTWALPVPPEPISAGTIHDLFLSPGADRAVVWNPSGALFMVSLRSGNLTALKDQGPLHFQATFTPDGNHLVYVDFLQLFIREVESGGVKTVNLSNMGERLAISPNGRTAAIGVSSNFDGSHFSIDLGLELIDIGTGNRIGLDGLGTSGQWLSLSFSPDGRTLQGTHTKPKLIAPATYGNFPCVTTWEIPTRHRLATIEHATSCGWCADGRLVLRSEEGDCFFADKGLVRQGAVRLPSGLAETNAVFVAATGKHLIVRHIQNPSAVVQFIMRRFRPGWIDSATAYWECFDLSGRMLASVPGWMGGCNLSPDGKYMAVGSPDDTTVDVYTLPPRTPGGVVLALMIAEVGLALAWTAWRRRLFRRRYDRPKPS